VVRSLGGWTLGGAAVVLGPVTHESAQATSGIDSKHAQRSPTIIDSEQEVASRGRYIVIAASAISLVRLYLDQLFSCSRGWNVVLELLLLESD
jgi:hypothetical protein